MTWQRQRGEEFLVHWKDYDRPDTTWEPFDNLTCTENGEEMVCRWKTDDMDKVRKCKVGVQMVVVAMGLKNFGIRRTVIMLLDIKSF